MAVCVLRAVLRRGHQPRARIGRRLLAPCLERGEHRVLERLLGAVEAPAKAQQPADDAAALAAHGLVDDLGQLRHSSRISSAPWTTNRDAAAQRTASSMLAMRRKNTPPMTSLLSRNGPS